MQRIFEALASTVRRKILAYLSEAELTAGEISARFAMSKPAVSQHLSILSAAGLVTSEKRGQSVYYKLVRDSLVNTLNDFVQEVCPVSKPLERENEGLARGRGAKEGNDVRFVANTQEVRSAEVPLPASPRTLGHAHVEVHLSGRPPGGRLTSSWPP
jgi:DNA-binding transcriptional ArsR family regulator